MKMIWKKFAAIVLLLSLITSGVPYRAHASEAASFTVPEGGYDGSPVTIRFYHTMGALLTAVLDNYIYEFNKLYPNITIEYTSVGGYDDLRDQIAEEIALGDAPNIAYCYGDHVALYNLAGAVVPLDDLIDDETVGLTDAQKADFIAGFFDEGRQFGDGLMYTLPMSKSTDVLYYNKTFFEEHNLTVPTTWEEMEQVCAAIKEIDPNSIPLGCDNESNWFINLCEQYGSPYTSATGDHFLFNNETNRGFVKMFRDWYQKGYVTTQTLYGAYTSGLFTNIEPNGIRCYMSIASSAGATYQRPAASEDGTYPFEVGIATIPQVDPASPKVTFKGPSLCLFKKDDPQEVMASWLFVKFLTTNVEFQSDFAMTSGYIPVLKSVEHNPVYAAYLAHADGGRYVAALSAKVCLEQESAYFAPPAFNGSANAANAVETLLWKCMSAEDGGSVDTMIANEFSKVVGNCKQTPDTCGLTGLAAAKAYLQLLYNTASFDTAENYTRVGAVRIDGVSYPVSWSVDTDAIQLLPSTDGMVAVDIIGGNLEEIHYTLTATLSDASGRTETVYFSHQIPPLPIINDTLSYEDIVRLAYTLEPGCAISAPLHLLGTVTRIDTPWNEDYQNITVTMQVGDMVDMPIMCYRLTGEGAKDIAIGDRILVEGYLKNFNGIIEFDAGSELIGRNDSIPNGLIMDENGIWWYYMDGIVQSSYTGLVFQNGTFFYVENGILNTGYTGLCYFAEQFYYVENGVLNFGYTGLCYFAGQFYYIENGVLNFDYTGLCYFAGAFYYIENGVLNFGYTGLCYFAGAFYYIESGVLNFGYTGLCYFADAFYYIENGVLNFGYTGLVCFADVWYYVSGGILDWSYSGPAYTSDGVLYNVVNGIAYP